MTRLRKLLFLLGTTLQSATLLANPSESQETEPPFDITATYDHIHSSKFQRPHARRHNSLSFAEANFIATYTQKLTPQNGLKYGIGYVNTHLDWDKHPRIDQKTFNNLLLSVGGYTKDRENWRWDANVYLQMNTKHLSLSRYTFFRGFLHGVYDWKKNLKLHAGLEGVTGMRYTRIWPSLGFEWEQSERLHINAVFPSNLSAIYSFDQHWSVSASAHYFFSRQRLGEDENDHLRRGLIAYRNIGLEAGLNYRIAGSLLANIHVGESLGGNVRVSRHNDKDRHHYKQKPAPYFGGAISFSF